MRLEIRSLGILDYVTFAHVPRRDMCKSDKIKRKRRKKKIGVEKKEDKRKKKRRPSLRRSLMLPSMSSPRKPKSPKLNQRQRKWLKGKLKLMLKMQSIRMLPIYKRLLSWPRSKLC